MSESCIPKYIAKNQYVECIYYEIEQVLYINVKFLSVEGVSAMHIHSAQSPNPILVWLLTSKEWQNGVVQTSFSSNSPCCSNQQCNVVAPIDIPTIETVKLNKIYQMIVSPPLNCVKDQIPCPWTSQGTLLNVHGNQFQFYDRCRISDGMPGVDLISSTTFEPYNDS